MKQYVFEVIEELNKKKTKPEKVKVLKDNESWALKDIIKGSMDSNIRWNLPEGEPPYTPSKPESTPTNLLREHKKFKYFLKGNRSSDGMIAPKRENIFIGLIEGIHPEDAKLVIGMINKKSIKGITKPIVEEAFPGLLSA